jgi:RNA polymerase sigma-70 factor, ECF subfamily
MRIFMTRRFAHPRRIRKREPAEGSESVSSDYHPLMLHTIEPSDEALARRVSDRDLDAFATLYDRYAPRVFTWAARTLGTSDAEDVTQDVFLRLWHRAAQFDPARGRFSAWFAAVARHEVVARLRRRSREHRIFASDEIDALLSSLPDDATPPDQRAWMSERDAALAAAVRSLPAEQRRVIVMAYFGGLSQSEIARAIATPLGTVKKRTSLALAKLRRAVVDDVGSGRRDHAHG